MQPYTISNARYAKGQKLICCHTNDQYKTRAHRLVEALKGRYTGRENGYIVSPTKAQRFEKLYLKGWDGKIMTAELVAPGTDLISKYRQYPK